MPPVADATRPDSNLFGQPPVDVTALYVPTLNYVVTGLQQTDRIRPRDGALIPTIQVAFQVPGSPGNFTILIDNYAFTHADVLGYMRKRSYLIRSLYSLPAVLPPFVDVAVPLTWPHVTLDTLTPATLNGAGALSWAGTVDTQNEPTTYHLEVFQIRQTDPWLVTDSQTLPAAVGPTPVSGIAGPLDPGSYTAQLWANNVNGNGEAGRGPVTVA